MYNIYTIFLLLRKNSLLKVKINHDIYTHDELVKILNKDKKYKFYTFTFTDFYNFVKDKDVKIYTFICQNHSFHNIKFKIFLILYEILRNCENTVKIWVLQFFYNFFVILKLAIKKFVYTLIRVCAITY